MSGADGRVEKWVLGWINPDVVDPGHLKNVTLREGTQGGPTNKAIEVRLPNYSYTVALVPPLDGKHWYSGSSDRLNNTLGKTNPYRQVHR